MAGSFLGPVEPDIVNDATLLIIYRFDPALRDNKQDAVDDNGFDPSQVHGYFTTLLNQEEYSDGHGDGWIVDIDSEVESRSRD
jgi:hypothetical protein